jgi:hypothetical protein
MIRATSCPRSASAGWRHALAIVVLAVALPALAAAEFPFDQDLLLDARPLPGSRRVPILNVEPDGRAQIDLWCRSGPAAVEIAGNEFRISLGPMREASCTPERAQRDDEMIAVLSEITSWRADADVVTLIGPRTLRFRVSSH